MGDNDESDDIPPRSLYVFGRDVAQIPCFRSSFLYGIGSGVVIGLGAFMTTSKPRLATHVGFSSFIMITFSYWCYCRYDYSRQSFLVRQVQEGMRRNAIFQGTDKERSITKEYEKEIKLAGEPKEA